MSRFNMDIVEMETAATEMLISMGIKAVWPKFRKEALYGLDEHQISVWVPLNEVIPEAGAGRTVGSMTPTLNMLGQIVTRSAWSLSRPGEEMSVEQNDLNYIRLQDPKADDRVLIQGKVIKSSLGAHRATFSISMWRDRLVNIANGTSSLCVLPTPKLPPTPIAVASAGSRSTAKNDSRPSAEATARSKSPSGGVGSSVPRSPSFQTPGDAVETMRSQEASDCPTAAASSQAVHTPDMDSEANPGPGPTPIGAQSSFIGRRDPFSGLQSQPPAKKIRASMLPRSEPIPSTPRPPLASRTSAPVATQGTVSNLPKSIIRRGSNAIPTRKVSFANIGDDDRVVSVHKFALFNVHTSRPGEDKTLENWAARLGFTPRNVRHEIMPTTHRNRYMYHFEVLGWREERKVASGYKGEEWSVRLDLGGWMINRIPFLLPDITVEQLVEAHFLALKMAAQHFRHAKRWPRRDDLLMRLADTNFIKEALTEPQPGEFTRLMSLLSARGKMIFENNVKARARA
ncbi:unnamed protein product [Caenorhabditis brenneri]